MLVYHVAARSDRLGDLGVAAWTGGAGASYDVEVSDVGARRASRSRRGGRCRCWRCSRSTSERLCLV